MPLLHIRNADNTAWLTVGSPWDEIPDKPATFPPSVHGATHDPDGADPIDALTREEMAAHVAPTLASLASSWWLGGGQILLADVLGAWQALGMASYEASLVNRAHPGTHDLALAATGSQPAWSVGNGWQFTDFDAKLDTGIVCNTASRTLVVSLPAAYNWTQDIGLAGVASDFALAIGKHTTSSRAVIQGTAEGLSSDLGTTPPTNGATVIALAGNSVYWNGQLWDACDVSGDPWTTFQGLTYWIGSDHVHTVPSLGVQTIQAVALYNRVLTADEIAAVTLHIQGGTANPHPQYAPTAHEHVAADVTDFNEAVLAIVPPGSHDPLTLDTPAQGLLALSDQELQLAAQAPHAVLAGPAASPDAAPTFRALAADDLPRLDQLTAPGADVAMNGYKLTGLAAPTTSSDAATRAYVDSHSGGPGGGGPQVSTYTVEGSLSGVGLCPFRFYNVWGAERSISKVMVSAAVAPTGAAVIVDVHQDGTTIFTNQAHRPQIAAGQNVGSTVDIDVAAWAADSYLQIAVDQCGSGLPGSHLVVQIVHS